MPLYKGIYYADGSTVMSAEAISAAEATSVGNAIENLATKVANATERDEKFLPQCRAMLYGAWTACGKNAILNFTTPALTGKARL